MVIGIFLANQEWQRLVINWFWSNLEKSLKVMAKALCGYKGLLVQCLEKWHGEKENSKFGLDNLAQNIPSTHNV